MAARDYVKGVRATLLALALGTILSAPSTLAQSEGGTGGTGSGTGTGTTVGTTYDNRDDSNGFNLGWLGLLGLAGLAGLKRNDRVALDPVARARA
jgi:MYXO-CTERM domain-containing protein